MPPRVRPPIWMWFTVLSLDAPVVALVWQDFLARCYPTKLLIQGRCVLGLTVWAIYLADRLLDVRHPASALESIRHRFYRRHRGFALTLLAAVVSVDLLVTVLWVLPSVLDNGLLLVGAVALYLGAFPFAGRSTALWKKPLAALLFTAGTFLVAWTTAGHAVRQLVWPAAAFCGLCLGNLWMIERWGQTTTPRGDAIPRGWLWLVFAAVCLVTAQNSNWWKAVIFSAIGLYGLARWGRKISYDARCVFADALLLTPLLFR